MCGPVGTPPHTFHLILTQFTHKKTVDQKLRANYNLLCFLFTEQSPKKLFYSIYFAFCSEQSPKKLFYSNHKFQPKNYRKMIHILISVDDAAQFSSSSRRHRPLLTSAGSSAKKLAKNPARIGGIPPVPAITSSGQAHPMAQMSAAAIGQCQH